MNELRIGNVTKLAGVTIIPVEEINIASEVSLTTKWWYGKKELFALVIKLSSGIQAFDKDAKPLSISDLIGSVPQLGGILESDVRSG